MRPVYTHTGESRHLPRTRCSDVARELREDTPPRTLPPSFSAPATLPVCTYNQPSATPVKPARQKKTAARSNRAGRPGGYIYTYISGSTRATAKFDSTPRSPEPVLGTGNTRPCRREPVDRSSSLHFYPSTFTRRSVFSGADGASADAIRIMIDVGGRHNKKQHDYSENNGIRAERFVALTLSPAAFVSLLGLQRTLSRNFRDENAETSRRRRPLSLGWRPRERLSGARGRRFHRILYYTTATTLLSFSLSSASPFPRAQLHSDARRNSTRRNAARALRAVAAVGRGPLPRRASRIVG